MEGRGVVHLKGDVQLVPNAISSFTLKKTGPRNVREGKSVELSLGERGWGFILHIVSGVSDYKIAFYIHIYSADLSWAIWQCIRTILRWCFSSAIPLSSVEVCWHTVVELKWYTYSWSKITVSNCYLSCTWHWFVLAMRKMLSSGRRELICLITPSFPSKHFSGNTLA